MAPILDDKSEHCIPFILGRLEVHQNKYKSIRQKAPPFFIGLNGVQGAGKTTLVESLCKTLSSSPYNLPTLVFSIDDLYLPHSDQVALASSHSTNPLVQHRGQPSTHEIRLGTSLFEAIRNREPDISVPSYDKSAFDGQGDRREQSEWHTVNTTAQGPNIEVVIFEGWCVGFRALNETELESKWKAARAKAQKPGSGYKGRLGLLVYEHVKFVNDKLRDYDEMTDRLDAFMHIDAEDPLFVYEWRQQQEAALRKARGTGMTVEQVNDFVNGYYPAYELYTDRLRRGIYGEPDKQLRLVVGQDRGVKEVHKS